MTMLQNNLEYIPNKLNFRDASELRRKIDLCLKENNIEISKIATDILSLKDNLDTHNLPKGIIDGLFNIYLALDSNKAFQDYILKIGLGFVKGPDETQVEINENFFDNNPESYYPIIINFLKINYLPFIKALLSSLNLKS